MKGFRAGRGIVRAKFPLKNTMTASLSSRPISRIVIHDNFVVHPRWSSTTSFFEPIVCCALRLTIGCSLPHTAPGAHGRGFHGAHSPEVGYIFKELGERGGGNSAWFVFIWMLWGWLLCKVFLHRASLVAQLVKNLPAMRETWVRSLDWEDMLEKEKLPSPIFWPREFYGLYSPWGWK